MFLNPAAALGIGDVHEFHAHAAAIDAPRFARPLVVDLQIGMWLGRQQAERIEFGFKIAKLPEQTEYAFPFVSLIARTLANGATVTKEEAIAELAAFVKPSWNQGDRQNFCCDCS